LVKTKKLLPLTTLAEVYLSKSFVSVLQALDTINEIGDQLRIKFSRMPVPDFSENDEDFHKRYQCFGELCLWVGCNASSQMLDLDSLHQSLSFSLFLSLSVDALCGYSPVW